MAKELIMHRKTDSSTEDSRVMHAFHYKQELRRTLRFFGSFAVALSFISLTTGIFRKYLAEELGCELDHLD